MTRPTAAGATAGEVDTIEPGAKRTRTAQVPLCPWDARLPPTPRIDLHRDRERLVVARAAPPR